jgi:Holliday junction resolvase RusA-like endonuclease
MTFVIHFHVEGIPKPKKRPRFRQFNGIVQSYTDKGTREYEDHVRLTSQTAMGTTEPIETAVGVYMYIRLPIPKSHSKKRTEDCLEGREKPIKKPDIDNLAKSLLDGMNGVVFKDDSQIVSLHCTKVYSSEPGVDIMVREELE